MGAKLLRRFAFRLAILALIPSAAWAQKVDGPHARHKWEYIPDSRAVFYGTPETDDTVVALRCVSGLLEISIPFDNKPTGSRGAAYNVTFRNKSEVTARFNLEKFIFGDVFEGWTGVAQISRQHPLVDLIKQDGIAEISAAYRYRISLAGARKVIEKLERDCPAATTASPTRPQSAIQDTTRSAINRASVSGRTEIQNQFRKSVGAVWSYSRSEGTLIYGAPDTDAGMMQLTCPNKGAAEIELVYSDQLEGDLMDGQIFSLDMRKDGASIPLTGILRKGSLAGESSKWKFSATLSVTHPIFERMKEAGDLDIGGKNSRRVTLDQASVLISQWQERCAHGSSEAKSSENEYSSYTLICDKEILDPLKPKLRQLKTPVSVKVEFTGTQSIRSKWGRDGNGGYGWHDMLYDDLTIKVGNRDLTGGQVFGSTYDASTSYDGQFSWAYSRGLSGHSFNAGPDSFLCRFRN